MPSGLLKPAVNGAAGFLIALVLWLALSVPYAILLASVSEAAIHIGEWSAATTLTPQRTLIAVDRIDFPPAPSRLAVESTDVTFNFILLMTLFAATSRPLSDRNVFGFAGAAAVLFFVHVFAVVAFVKAHFALNFGSWSAAHYGVVARWFWGRAPYFYSVAGVYGFAFVLWWLFRPPPAPSPETAPRAAPRRRRRS